MNESPLASSLPRPLAFVLAGGASLGALQVGMLRPFVERDIVPDCIVGTSVGAINGAYMASNFDPKQLTRLEAIWGEMTTETVFGGVGFRSIGRMLGWGGGRHLATSEGLVEVLETHLPETHDALDIPMIAVATELLRGQMVLLDSGPLPRHVLASASIPGVFPSIEVDDRDLVDGGVAANVPLLPAHRLGVASMVVFDPSYPCALSELPSSVLGHTMHIVTLVLRHQSQSLLHLLEHEETILYPPPPCPVETPPHVFSDSEQLIEQGRHAAERFLEGLDISGEGIYGHPHVHDSELEIDLPWLS